MGKFPRRLLPILTLASCAPPLAAPDTHVAVASYTRQPVNAPITTTLPVAAEWWQGFKSPQIDALIAKALADSATLQEASQNLITAQQNAVAANGAFLPQIGLNPGQPNISRTAEPGGPNGFPPYTIYAFGGTVSYDPGLFGARKYSFENGAALTDYQNAELDAARQSLAGNIAAAAISLAGFQAQIATTKNIAAVEQKLLTLLQGEFEDGAISQLTVLQQQAQILATQETLPALQTNADTQTDRLAVLSAQLPGEFSAPAISLDDLAIPSPIPVKIPSEYLANRPDLRAARANVAAQNAALGIAIAHLYPDLQLSASGGWVGETFNTLFNTTSAFYSLAGNLLAPIYQGGQLHARKAAAQAQLAEALAAYHDAVFTAFGEAADALHALGNDETAFTIAGQAKDTAVAAYNLATQQYKLGAVDYTTVLTAQTLAAQQALILVQARTALLLDIARLDAAMAD
jgi:NodT family efflux transporter outer membrane factor (OMF) lipoprotein